MTAGRRTPDTGPQSPEDQHVDRELEEEISFHLERTVEELRAAGNSEEDARTEALRRFGDIAAYRSELRGIDHERVALRPREANLRILPRHCATSSAS